MHEALTVFVNGRAVKVPAGSTAVAALTLAGLDAARQSVSGTPRGPLCGMGICFECCALVNGQRQRTCQVICEQGMEIRTDDQ
jgi:aerobic-type carbon monoxide dehydrogenase small subunit (CoxS/CutS family)